MIARAPQIAALAFALAWTAACGGDPGTGQPDGAPPPGELTLGAGSDDGYGFFPITDGDDQTLIGGAQGGYHLWTGVRVQGVEGRLELVREARRLSDDALVLRAPAQPIEVPADAMDDWWERPDATPSFMCPAPIGIQVYDEPLQLTGRLYNSDDELLAEDTIEVVPRCPTGELADHCHSVCGG